MREVTNWNLQHKSVERKAALRVRRHNRIFDTLMSSSTALYALDTRARRRFAADNRKPQL